MSEATARASVWFMMLLIAAWAVLVSVEVDAQEEAAARLEQQTVVHEIGHQVLESGTHTPNTIMHKTMPVAPAYEVSSDTDIATMRHDKPSSPGT